MHAQHWTICAYKGGWHLLFALYGHRDFGKYKEDVCWGLVCAHLYTNWGVVVRLGSSIDARSRGRSADTQ